MLVVASREAVIELAVRGLEGRAGRRIVIHADDIDVVGSRPPGLDVGDRVDIGAPEHEDFGVAGHSGVDGLPGGDEFVRSYDALRC